MVDGLFMFVMWAIMMVGMMLPSAAPMTLLYAGMVRKAERQGTPMASIAFFVSGYLAM
jgi:predicted metal-binding membrane protein